MMSRVGSTPGPGVNRLSRFADWLAGEGGPRRSRSRRTTTGLYPPSRGAAAAVPTGVSVGVEVGARGIGVREGVGSARGEDGAAVARSPGVRLRTGGFGLDAQGDIGIHDGVVADIGFNGRVDGGGGTSPMHVKSASGAGN